MNNIRCATLQKVLSHGILEKLGKCCGLGRPEPMIKFRNDAVTNGVLKGVGFSGENEKGMRSLSLNCNIATLPREP